MSRSISQDLENPDLFKEYQAGNYEYGSLNDRGKYATGSLTLVSNAPRDSKAQTTAGGEQRRDSDDEWGPDDGGHLIGTRFGGSPSYENLTAQNRNLNRSDYKAMENEWANHLSKGDKVFVHIETDGMDRPNAYMGYVIYEKPDGTRTYDTFHMINESRTEIAKWEEEAEEFERELYEKGLADEYLGNVQSKNEDALKEENNYMGDIHTSANTEDHNEYLGEDLSDTETEDNNDYLGQTVTADQTTDNSEYLGDAASVTTSSHDSSQGSGSENDNSMDT